MIKTESLIVKKNIGQNIVKSEPWQNVCKIIQPLYKQLAIFIDS